jgi:hypothetical protein
MKHGDKSMRTWREEQATPLPPVSEYKASPYLGAGSDTGSGMTLGNNDQARLRTLQILFAKPSAMDDPNFCKPPRHGPIASSRPPPLRRR